ncbi:MAG TPA: alpha/beta fold hydrolase [Longimicrobium sp.]|nr:alpha/beta fold hydrolase [Longimicrobium sp.]
MMMCSLARVTPLCAVLALAPAAAQPPAFEPRPCPRTMEDARCGTVRVPENRDAPGRMLGLNVVVLPARSASPAREAVAFFAGGPGQAATQMAPYVAPTFSPLRDTRDLLFVDQRGTGGSAPLQCALRDTANPQSYLGDYLPADAVARCRDELSRMADLTRYGTRELAHDTEAVRVALGYERLDLHGVSYGSRAALAYLRAYPSRVRSVVLRALVPPQYRQPDGFARDLEAALQGLFAECRADAFCRATYPDPDGELRAVADRLAGAPATFDIPDPDSGVRIRVTLTREVFVEVIRRMLYDPLAARGVPYAVRRAYRGDYRTLAAAALRDRRMFARAAWWGLHLAVTCSEDLPFIDHAAADDGDALAGGYRLRQYIQACRGWPTFAHPEEDRRTFRSDVPALLISGALDPVTPPRWGDAAAAIFPGGLHLVVPYAAHSTIGLENSGCVDSLVIQFYRQGSARGLDTSCLRGIRPPPFAPGSSAPAGGTGQDG